MNDSRSPAGTWTTPSPAHYLWQQAAAIAADAHQGQTPPGSEMPYIAHPARVAMLVSAVFGCHDSEVLAAAYLHDVLEKTSLTRETVAVTMGPTVTSWVEWLSKNVKGEKGDYWKRLEDSPWQVRLIKMADALDHLNGPPQYLKDRLKTARKALKLASSEEPEIQRAAQAITRVIGTLASDNDTVDAGRN